MTKSDILIFCIVTTCILFTINYYNEYENSRINVVISYIICVWTIIILDTYYTRRIRNYKYIMNNIRSDPYSLALISKQTKKMCYTAVLVDEFSLVHIKKQTHALCASVCRRDGKRLSSCRIHTRKLYFDTIKSKRYYISDFREVNSELLLEMCDNYNNINAFYGVEREINIECVKRNGNNIKFVPREMRDYNIWHLALETAPELICEAETNINDYKKLCIFALESGSKKINFQQLFSKICRLPNKDVFDICFVAIKNDKSNLFHIDVCVDGYKELCLLSKQIEYVRKDFLSEEDYREICFKYIQQKNNFYEEDIFFNCLKKIKLCF